MDWKKLIAGLLYPKPGVLWLLGPGALGLLIYSALCLEASSVISIISYVLSFYALAACVLRAPEMARYVNRVRKENRYLVRYAQDERLRMNISLHGAFIFNGVYAVLQLGLGIWHHSAWFYAMAGYYFLLAAMRLMLARQIYRHEMGREREMEWKKYRLCGVMLLLITLALVIFVLYYVYKIRVFYHHEITVIAMALFTFISLATAIINALRCRGGSSPVCAAARAVALASGAVSMLALENAMLTAFGQESSPLFHRLMLGMTGGAVLILVLGMAVFMIWRAGRKLKEMRSE